MNSNTTDNVAKTSNSNEKSIRQPGLDVVRIIASISVVAVHFYLNCNFYQTPLQGPKMFVMTCSRWLFMICVPLFMMLTGYLKCHKTATKAHYLSLIPIIISYIIISFGKIIISNIYYGAGFYTFSSGLKAIATYRIAWYVGMYVGLMLIIPFLNKLIGALSQKEFKWLIISFVLIACVFPIVQYVIPSYWQAIYPLAYYFIGAYIREYRPKVNKWILSGAVVIMTLINGTVSYIAAGGEFFRNDVLAAVDSGYSVVTVLVATVAVFLMFYDSFEESTEMNKGVSGILQIISSASLEIYLFTGVFDVIIFSFLKQTYTMASEMFWLFFITVPLNFVCSAICGIIVNKFVRWIYNLFVKNK